MLTSSLVIDVWGQQQSGDEAAGNRKTSTIANSNNTNNKGASTKQLMNEEQTARGRTNTMIKRDDDERYKMLCEINTQKRRAERNAKKLVSVIT